MRRTSKEPASELARARSACEARDWREAYELLREADRGGGLGPDGLELLADCARWTGRLDEIFDPLERAHAAYVAKSDRRAAARTALVLSQANGDVANQTVAAVWMKRAGELLADLPEGPEHALYAWFESQARGWAGEFDAQERCAGRALDLACRFGDRDVEALARIDLAHVAVARARVVPAPAADLAELRPRKDHVRRQRLRELGRRRRALPFGSVEVGRASCRERV